MRMFLAAVLLCILSGCASAQTKVRAADPAPAPEVSQSLIERARADLQAAAALADKATDPMAPTRAACYRALYAHLPVGPILPQGEAIGLASRFELTAEFAETVKGQADAGVPMDVRLSCAPVVARGNEILLAFNLRLIGAASLLPK